MRHISVTEQTPVVREQNLQNLAAPRVNDANELVLARCHDLAAVVVEVNRPNEIRVAVDLHQSLASAHVPNEYFQVGA